MEYVENLGSYLGLDQPRLEGDKYLQVVDEFVAAVKARWPKVLIQVRYVCVTTHGVVMLHGMHCGHTAFSLHVFFG